MIKQSILIAALTVFLSSFALESANAQCFQPCGACAFQRPVLFPRLRAFFRCGWNYDCGVDMSANRVEYRRGACSTGTCNGGTCPVDEPKADELPPAPPVPDCSLGTCSEYVPTEDGDVPIEAANAREKLVAALNRVRTRYGRWALTFDEDLGRRAQYQAGFCSRCGYLQHASGVAEILAQNSSDFDGAIRQWLASGPHLAILTSTHFSRCGIGVVRDRYGRVWYSVQFR